MNIKKAGFSLFISLVLVGIVLIVNGFIGKPISEREKIVETISSILKEEYGHLNLAIEVKEDTITDYSGENTDYFENAISRNSQNHLILTITWQNSGENSNEYIEIFSGMAEVIEGRLPYKTPNLMFIMKVNDTIPGKGPVFLDNKVLFPQ